MIKIGLQLAPLKSSNEQWLDATYSSLRRRIVEHDNETRDVSRYSSYLVDLHPVWTTPVKLPAPWHVEEPGACLIVRNGSRQALAYVYFEDGPGRRSAVKLFTRDDASR